MGADIRHIDRWNRDDAIIYHMIYEDSETMRAYAKRFTVGGIIRDKVYPLGRTEKARLLYLSVWKTDTKEIVTVQLDPKSSAHKKVLTFDFSKMEIKSRTAQGNVVTKYPVKSVKRAS
jgi:topoisomerase-4 subunit A